MASAETRSFSPGDVENESKDVQGSTEGHRKKKKKEYKKKKA